MSWWGEPQMKRKMKMAKAKPSLPAMFGKTPKKPEPDDKPPMPRKKLGAMGRKRLADRAI